MFCAPTGAYTSPIILLAVEFITIIGNLAYGQNAVQRTTHSPHEASRSVDGDTNHEISGGSCSFCQSGETEACWWRVDLRGLHVVLTVTLYYNQGTS